MGLNIKRQILPLILMSSNISSVAGHQAIKAYIVFESIKLLIRSQKLHNKIVINSVHIKSSNPIESSVRLLSGSSIYNRLLLHALTINDRVVNNAQTAYVRPFIAKTTFEHWNILDFSRSRFFLFFRSCRPNERRKKKSDAIGELIHICCTIRLSLRFTRDGVFYVRHAT